MSAIDSTPSTSDARAAAQVASVVVLRLADFAARPLAEQAQLSERLEVALAAAIEPLDPAGRIVLDAPEGAALALLGEPSDALDVGARVQAAAPALPLCVGINHGPVRLARDRSHGPALVGDALTAGAHIAGFATPGGTLVSRSFRDALAAVAPARAKRLRPAGTFTDATVRAHEVFAADRAAPAASARRWFLIGAVGVVGIVAAGLAVRRTRHLAALEAQRPATVEFAVSPSGEVLVDGVVRGTTPPLQRIEVSPGRHTIEVHNGNHAPVKLQVELAARETVTVSHDFPPPPVIAEPLPAVAEPPAAPAAAPPKAAAAARPRPVPPAAAKNGRPAPAQKSGDPAIRKFKEDIRQAGRQASEFFRGLGR
jgi:hypothetical protein